MGGHRYTGQCCGGFFFQHRFIQSLQDYWIFHYKAFLHEFPWVVVRSCLFPKWCQSQWPSLPTQRREWSQHREVLRTAACVPIPQLMTTATWPHDSIPIPWVGRIKSLTRLSPQGYLLSICLEAKLHCLIFHSKLRYNSYSEIRLERRPK